MPQNTSSNARIVHWGCSWRNLPYNLLFGHPFSHAQETKQVLLEMGINKWKFSFVYLKVAKKIYLKCSCQNNYNYYMRSWMLPVFWYNFNIYMYQIITLYTLYLPNFILQFHLINLENKDLCLSTIFYMIKRAGVTVSCKRVSTSYGISP